MIRIGHGFDVHAFEEGDALIIGGVSIPFHRAFKAHSDGDVLIHALCDALLGALALGDIGRHFPDNDDNFKSIDSRILLRRVIEMLTEKNWSVGNADMTVIAQAPKLSPYLPMMVKYLAEDMKIDISAVNVKATTTENLGFTGRGEGIAAHAVVCLIENQKG